VSRHDGGFIGVEDLLDQLRCRSDQPISRLARWIVSRAVIGIPWRAQTLMSAFQFEFANAPVKPSCAGVYAEFAGVHSEWETALWRLDTQCRAGRADAGRATRPGLHGSPACGARGDRFIVTRCLAPISH